MSKRYDCRNPQERAAGIEAAVTAARAGELIVLPTDTVYGIGADAFIPAAVTTMLAAKGRGRNMPPPVLVRTARDEAEQQLGEAVSIYLDGGPCTDNVPSTILDLTGTIPKVLRSGAISVDRLRLVSSVIAENEHYAEEPADVKPAEPHPLETDPVDPATGEPPSVP